MIVILLANQAPNYCLLLKPARTALDTDANICHLHCRCIVDTITSHPYTVAKLAEHVDNDELMLWVYLREPISASDQLTNVCTDMVDLIVRRRGCARCIILNTKVMTSTTIFIRF